MKTPKKASKKNVKNVKRVFTTKELIKSATGDPKSNSEKPDIDFQLLARSVRNNPSYKEILASAKGKS